MQLMHKCGGFVATTYIVLHTHYIYIYVLSWSNHEFPTLESTQICQYK
jgi:hypothetical protein